MSHYILSKPVPKRETSIMDAIYDKTESVWEAMMRQSLRTANTPKASKKYDSGFFY